MATNILTVGDTAANSADVTVAEGASLTVCLKYDTEQTSDGAVVDIQLKDDSAAYWQTGAKLTAYQPVLVIQGAGTYRFSRAAGESCGVFSA